jgi:hypothetical protein
MNSALADPNAVVSRRALTVGLIIAIGGTLGVLVITDLLSGSGNSLAKLARTLAAAGFVASVLNPRLGVYLLVLSTAYLDLLKRMLVFYDRPTMIDLYYVLGVAPLIMAGVTAGILAGGLLGRFHLHRMHWLMLVFAIACNGMVALVAIQDGGLMNAGKVVANDSFYCLLLFAVPVLFRSLDDFWKLIRFALWVFVPVAAYGIYQSIHGLSMFEIAYLQSGLTIMIKELDDVRPRPFSTLNSSGALAFACATMFVLSLLPWILSNRRRVIAEHRWVYAMMAVLFFAATVASLARSAHIVWMIALPCLFFFSTRRRMLMFYGSALTGYLTLVMSSAWILKMLPYWDSFMPKGMPFLAQLTRLQTFSDRLKSFDQLKRAETYSWLGLDHEIVSHDAITTGIARYGMLPMATVALVGMLLLVKVHRALLKLPSVNERRAASLLLGLSAATFAGGALVGGVFGTFPNNVYWWMMIGGLAMMTVARRMPVESLENVPGEVEADELVEEPATPVASPDGSRVVGHEARGGFPFRASGRPVTLNG